MSAHYLHPELVVSHLPENVAVVQWNEVIELINTPVPVSVRMRFSESKLSSSNLPNFKLSHGLPLMLSSRAITVSKWKAPVESEEGRR